MKIKYITTEYRKTPRPPNTLWIRNLNLIICQSLPELVRHHFINPVYFINVLRYPISNPCNPPINLLNKVDEWEMNHTEIFIKDRLKIFGQYYEEVYRGFTKKLGRHCDRENIHSELIQYTMTMAMKRERDFAIIRVTLCR